MNSSSPSLIAYLNKHIFDGGFLQSDEWRSFQEATGKRVFIFTSEHCHASIIEYTLPLVGRYWYIPRGPVLQTNKESLTETSQCIADIIKKARVEGVRFIRFEPVNEQELIVWQEESGLFTRKLSFSVQPQELFIVDISQDEDVLLSQMKSKTRYNIRLAQKKGVNVRTSHDQKDIDAFCDLVEITAKRDGIVSHPREHYLTMFQYMPDDMITLYVAEYQGNIIAANLVIFYGDYATYLHGASGNDHRDAMAPYLLQWQQIQDAKKRGCTYYDFGGVNTSHDHSNSWAGITRFKQGFSSVTVSHRGIGTYDSVISVGWYRIYRTIQWCAKKIRKIM